MGDLFVGREQELALLGRAFDDAVDGRGQLVLLAGEPGIGKSRLAAEFASRATAAGAFVAWGRCWELGGAPAYWPWTEALRSLVPQDAVLATDDQTLSSQLARIVPELAPGAPTTDQHVDDGARFRLFDAVSGALRRSSSGRPLVVVLEDLHAADEPSLLLLGFVVRALPAMPVLAIGTYRDVELSAGHRFTAVLAELLRERSTTRAVLTGLDDDEVAHVIEASTGEAPSRDVAAWVRDHTYGNPLYVREVSRLLAVDGRLPEIGGRLSVPKDVNETILRRLAQLPPSCRSALGFAAVIGREFSVELLVALRGRDAIDDIQSAVHAGLIHPGLAAGTLRFTHAVVSEAVYDALSPALRMEIHLQVAETIERVHAQDLDAQLTALARHFSAALPVGDATKAVEAARRAGDRAVSRLAYEEGARLYGTAIAAASGIADPGVHVDLLLRLGDAQARAGQSAAAKATFLEASILARESELWPELARAALGYGGRFVWTRAANDAHLVPLLRQALAATPEDDPVTRVRLLARLAGALRDEVSPRARDSLSAEALDIAHRLDDPPLLAYALAGRFTAIWAPETCEEMRRIADALVGVAEASGDPESAAYALPVSFVADLLVGEADRCREQLMRLHRVGEGLRQPSVRWCADMLGATILVMEGRLEQAEAASRSARSLGERVEAWDSLVSYRLELSLVRWAQGRLGEMQGEIEDALVASPGYRFFRCLLPLLHLETAQPDRARGMAEELLAGGEETLPRGSDWLGCMTVLAEIVTRLGLDHLAAPMYDALAPFAELVGSSGGEAVTGSVHRPLGQLAGLLGREQAAVTHLERALEIHARMRAELWLAHTELDMAVVLLGATASSQQQARQLLDRALHRSRTLGLTALGARIEALLSARYPAGHERPGGLTKREVEVAALLAGGASNRAIADALVISERTAETHVQNILVKLGFTTRAHVAAWAISQGLASGT